MLIYLCLAISAAVFFLSVAFAVFISWRPYRSKYIFKAFYVFAGGLFLSATILFIPFNSPSFRDSFMSVFTTLLISIHNTIRLFIVDCDFAFVLEFTENLPYITRSCYVLLLSLFFVIAPILTVGVVLSFFESLSAHNRYAFGFFRDAYIFSELNDRSITLAKSIKANNPSGMIVFTDVFKKDDETSYELVEQAKSINAILFKKDITVINFRFHSKKTKLYFFVIGSNEAEDINQTISLSAEYHPQKLFSSTAGDSAGGYDYPREDSRLYLFSTNSSSEQHLSAINTKYIKLRRINHVQSMIYNIILYNHGMQIFDSAKDTENKVFNSVTKEYDTEKKISAMVVGMGRHGTEMIKALSWFCQMHPYKIEINAFDKNEHADSVFRSQCPDLFDCNPPFLDKEDSDVYRNGDFDTPGESHYKISVFPDCDASLYSFDEKIKQLADTTYVFVALGDDDKNIQVATKIRILLKRLGTEPVIHAIVYNPNNQHMLAHGRTASGHSYNIIPFGGIASTYSESCILQSELEQKALGRHMEYVYQVIDSQNIEGEERQKRISAEEETFWKYDYNYRSSVASVLHTEFKKKCKSPGSEKAPADRTEDEKWFYRRMEHQRWNAYVRSEGYVYNPVRDKMAKTHHLLVPFDDLPYEEQIKDDN